MSLLSLVMFVCIFFTYFLIFSVDLNKHFGRQNSRNMTLLWGATGEQEWTPALTTGANNFLLWNFKYLPQHALLTKTNDLLLLGPNQYLNQNKMFWKENKNSLFFMLIMDVENRSWKSYYRSDFQIYAALDTYGVVVLEKPFKNKSVSFQFGFCFC